MTAKRVMVSRSEIGGGVLISLRYKGESDSFFFPYYDPGDNSMSETSFEIGQWCASMEMPFDEFKYVVNAVSENLSVVSPLMGVRFRKENGLVP